MDQLLQQIFGIAFLVYGISHIAAPMAWFDFFLNMKRAGNAGIIIGMYTFPQGLVIVVLHNKWSWDWSLVLTVIGWGMMSKGILYLTYPAWTDTVISENESFAAKYRWAGWILLVLAGPMLYCGFWR